MSDPYQAVEAHRQMREQLLAAITEQSERMRDAKKQRDQLIKAAAAAGLTRRVIADAAGMTAQNVSLIVANGD